MPKQKPVENTEVSPENPELMNDTTTKKPPAQKTNAQKTPKKKTGRPKGRTQFLDTPIAETRTFMQIVREMNPEGQYTDVQPIEFKAALKPSATRKFERNWLKNLSMSLMAQAGFSPMQVSYMLNIPPSTISMWRANATPETLAQIEIAEVKQVTNRIAQAVNTTLSCVERVALYVSEREYINKNEPEKIVKVFDALTGFATKLIAAKQAMDLAKRQIDADKEFPFIDQTDHVIDDQPSESSNINDLANQPPTE